MTIGPRERHLSRQFASTLQTPGAADAALLALARLSGALNPGLAVTGASEDFRLGLRNRLVALDASSPVRVTAGAAGWRRRLVAASAVLAIASGGAVATAVASSDALPGDRLYEVKRAVEAVQLTLAGSDLAKGERYLAIAATRLSEVQALLARNPAAGEDPAMVQELRETMSDASAALAAGSERFFAVFQRTVDPAVLAPLEQFLADRAGTLAEVRKLLPAQLLPKQDSLIRELEAIAARVATAIGEPVTALSPELSATGTTLRPTARAGRVHTRTMLSIDRTVSDVDKAVTAARRDAEAEAEAAAARQAESNAEVERKVRTLIEVDLFGDRGQASAEPLHGVTGEGASGHPSLRTSQGSSTSGAALLLGLLPVPELSLDTALPGSLTASLDLDGNRISGKHARLRTSY